MKYILIIFLSFMFAVPALAARQVSGTVPQVEPLQPPSQFAHPNISNNVQYQSVPGESSADGAASSSVANTVTASNDVALITTDSAPHNSTAPLIYFLLAVIGAAAVYVVYSRYSDKR